MDGADRDNLVEMKLAARVSMLGLAALTACGTGRPSQPTSHPVAVAPSSTSDTCHPYVSGCGCAFLCVSGIRPGPPGNGKSKWQVTNDMWDSRVEEAVLERWCFDDEGHGFPARKAPAKARRCLDVFYDEKAEHPECRPTTAFLGCHLNGTRCTQ